MFNLQNYNINIFFVLGLIFFFNIVRYFYILYCKKINFNRLELLFQRKLKWEKDLEIYSIALPKFYSNSKKNKCVLLISGFRDIPFVWDDLCKHFEKDNLDYYAPRTFGNGRSFFQDSSDNDWIITYLEAIYVLQEIYNEIDIIGFSAGCVITLYLSQFKYKCKIKNIILIAPFLLKNKTLIDYMIESKLSFIIIPLIKYFLPFRIKTPENNFKYNRDIFYEPNAKNDYYELVGCVDIELKLLRFKNLRPKIILAENIFIFSSKNDSAIGNIYEQQKIIIDIFNKHVPIIFIPSENIVNNFNENILCGHIIMKEHPLIIKNIYSFIKNIVIYKN